MNLLDWLITGYSVGFLISWRLWFKEWIGVRRRRRTRRDPLNWDDFWVAFWVALWTSCLWPVLFPFIFVAALFVGIDNGAKRIGLERMIFILGGTSRADRKQLRMKS
jgi:hypothetical protein